MKPTSEFDDAARELDIELDAEAMRLMRLGVPTLDALIQARQRVRQRAAVRPGDAPQTPACEGTCKAWLAPCGAAFCTYEEMAQHTCRPGDAQRDTE